MKAIIEARLNELVQSRQAMLAQMETLKANKFAHDGAIEVLQTLLKEPEPEPSDVPTP